MDIKAILGNYHKDRTISKEIIHLIQTDSQLRVSLVNYFRQDNDHDFAISLLDTFISIRQQPESEMPAEDLMLACYILGLHNQVEDCLKIWDAKNVDFDTYCGLDIQLVVFAGAITTIEFLKKQTTISGKKAFDYVSKCSKYGDFDSLDTYFSKDTLPWFA